MKESMFDKTKTQSIYLYLVTSKNLDPYLTVSEMDLSCSDDYHLLATKEIKFIVPEMTQAAVVQIQVGALKKEKQKIQAETQIELEKIDESIQKLMAIEDQSSQ